MENKTAVVVGVAALVTVLAIFGGVAYAAGGQMGSVGHNFAGMMQGQTYGGSMMGGAYSGGMMGGYSGMMGGGYSGMMGSGAGTYGCGGYMQQYLNSTYSH